MQTQVSKEKATIIIAQAAMMAALTAALTAFPQVPIPATSGYLNFGDVMIFVSAFCFGPIVGGFAGGVGSAISDIATGYGYYSPFTLIIKGTEGLIAGLISNRVNRKRDGLAVVVAGAEMVTGYFLAEFFGLSKGWAALAEVPFNIVQIVVGGTIGISIAIVLRKRLPKNWLKLRSSEEKGATA